MKYTEKVGGTVEDEDVRASSETQDYFYNIYNISKQFFENLLA